MTINDENMICDNIVLWGRGSRGEDALFLLKGRNTNVVAVIDSNEDYWGTYWNNIPVISFDEYLQKYRNYSIMITPKHCFEIEQILNNNNIINYSKLHETFEHIYNFSFSKNAVPTNIDMQIDLSEDEFYNKIYCGCTGIININLLKVLQDKQYVACGSSNDIFRELFKTANVIVHEQKYRKINKATDAILLHGTLNDYFNTRLQIYSLKSDIPIYFTEDAFICTVKPFFHRGRIPKYYMPHSFVIDKGGLYYKADSSSYLESLLESSRELSNDEYSRAQKVIKTIIRNKVSKYNHQPIKNINIGRPGRKKILIIDQVEGDLSISYGLANSNTFIEMYDAAIKENPDADIIIKSHPDKIRGHYGNIELASNVYLMDEPINPISLLEYVDKVYVCTSQMGFEALMCDKEVHVFGMPFYAGWGVTQDRLKCERRTRKRTVEEIFYFAYIEYSYYVSYETNSECDIEQCIDELLELRNEYFKKMSMDSFINVNVCPPVDYSGRN